MAGPIHRVTLFKIENKDDQERLLQFYQQMQRKALKVSLNPPLASHSSPVPQTLMDATYQDGKPYIQSVTAGPTKADQRAQGFTFAAISVFGSLDDMAYYDDECAAHAELKAFAKTVHSGAMMVFLENAV
ncbi:hypothetical protein ED733_006425 [Metarhizium rileyi]|nr:hypothetical protein ED733_006425 [Metarhizium rileyi]